MRIILENGLVLFGEPRIGTKSLFGLVSLLQAVSVGIRKHMRVVLPEGRQAGTPAIQLILLVIVGVEQRHGLLADEPVAAHNRVRDRGYLNEYAGINMMRISFFVLLGCFSPLVGLRLVRVQVEVVLLSLA